MITFTNTGTAPLTPLTISVNGSSDYTQANNCPQSLAANASCTVTITFTPGIVETTSSATLTATSPLVTASANISGSESLFISLTSSVSSLTFAPQLLSSTSPAQLVKGFNQGNEPVSVGVSVSTNYAETDTCSSGIAVAGSCTVMVTFDPMLYLGTLTGAVRVKLLGRQRSNIKPLSGTGVGGRHSDGSSQPQSQSIVFGNSVSFFVTASGTAPFTYQWQKNNVNITGATSSSYTYTPVLADQAASFTVRVTNLYGNQTSNPAVLTFCYSLPTITAQPQSTTVTLWDKRQAFPVPSVRNGSALKLPVEQKRYADQSSNIVNVHDASDYISR